MAKISDVDKAFEEYGRNIRRLKQMESELNALDLSGFESEERSIRSKLKSPQMTQQVEAELDALKQAIDQSSTPVRRPVRTMPDAVTPDKYEAMEFIGAGGFAEVYKSIRKEDGLVVALKIPKFDQFRTIDPKGFLKEAEIWSRLDHPNIVKVIEHGSKPYPWIAMEYMAKGSVRSIIGSMTLSESIDFALKLCDALSYTHNLGVFHSDIKPENILCDEDNNPKLSDWGLGRIMLEHSTTMDRGMTLAYSSPEQVNPEVFGKPGWWTDIYQCGVLLYEMITGMRPIRGNNLGEVVRNIEHAEVTKPSEFKPGLPEQLDEIVLKCLAKRKEERYSYMPNLHAALENLRKAL